MCEMCAAFGLKTESVTPEPSAATTGRLVNNGDGTYTLTLNEQELKNLTVRLAMSVLAERRGF